jgi:hypothetical protein
MYRIKQVIKRCSVYLKHSVFSVNPLNAKLNPICPLAALFGAHHILHVSRIRVNVRIVSVCVIFA